MCSGTKWILMAVKPDSNAFNINHRIPLWHEFLCICLKGSCLTEQNEVLVKMLEKEKDFKASWKCVWIHT